MQDRLIIQITVYGVFFVEAFHTGIITEVVWALLCDGWGEQAALLRISWTDAFIPITAGVVSGWVQAFYAWRIWVLGGRSKKWTIVAISIIPFSIISTVSACYAGFRTITDTSLPEILIATEAIRVWLVFTMICDLIIAVSMVFVVQASRHRVRGSGNQVTEQRLTRVIRLSIETGVATMTGAIIMFVFFLVLKDSRLFTMMGFINSKLYSNSLMASFNSRGYANAQATASFGGQTASNSFHGSGGNVTVNTNRKSTASHLVNVNFVPGERRRSVDLQRALPSIPDSEAYPMARIRGDPPKSPAFDEMEV
ncbi:hypothetical protein OF83DRAFT_1150863 [Amylostereum chailletii]|nr:hypothetical protein OF83DRAFT_1150863 [Amylostereum chailletii]